jgi:hypothetical protein
MKSTFSKALLHSSGIFTVALAIRLIVVGGAFAEEQTSQPVVRVATETPAAQPTTAQNSAATVAVPVRATARTPLDLTAKAGEHPLVPVLKALKMSQEELDRNIHDYSCTFVKRERVNGELGDYQFILLKVMHQPFSVYMRFQQPYAGREVVYVNGQNKGNLVALDAGFNRVFGKLNLDPNGTRAMTGQKYPITAVGIQNLISKLTKMWEAETKFAECNVTSEAGKKVEGRTATLVMVEHPKARQSFKFHKARLYIDDELRIPIHFDAFLWPAEEGATPPLEESYTYARNLKVNNNLTARDFDAYNNPDIFKK